MSEITSDLALSSWELQSFNRWFLEQDKMKAFPTFKLLGVGGNVVAAEGFLKTQVGNTYGLRIELKNFPYQRPDIFPKGWTPHVYAPHRFNNGSLCIMRADQWRKHFTIALVIQKAAVWLAKYEIWQGNNHDWPGLEQRH